MSQSSSQKPWLERIIDTVEQRRDALLDKRLNQDLRSQKLRGATEKFLTRTTSGVIYAVSIVACLYAGVIPTALIISAMAWLCCSEFYRIARKSGRMPNELLGLAAALLFPLSPLVSRGLGGFMFIMTVMMTCLAIWYVFTPRANLSDVAITAFGPIYTSLTLSALVIIRASEQGFYGALLTFGVMGSIWLNDSGAYLIGSRFGKHKLAPKISPNKSVEGLWGGMFFAMLIWIVLYLIGYWKISLPLALVTGLLVGFMSVVGDLFESRIKRGVGIKDSGTIMPGHGGLLDRSDSLIFGALMAFICLRMGGII